MRTAGPVAAPDQHRRQWALERQWAARLRNADRTERPRLYRQAYDHLYREFPTIHIVDERKRRRRLRKQVRFLAGFVEPQHIFLELGPGRCDLALAMARRCRRVVAVDVSAEVTGRNDLPGNVSLHISDGTSVPVAAGSVDVAYSDQLMEHLHPDDAFAQLVNVVTALRPGGIYLCVTPSRYSGPHDISRGFDDRASGLHLKEYSVRELRELFMAAGFRRVVAYVGGGGRFVPVGIGLVAAVERGLDGLPGPLARRLARSLPLRPLLGIRIAGVK